MTLWFDAPDGCAVSPKCVDCPLPVCRLDDEGPYRVWLRNHRLVEPVVALAEQGQSVQAIATLCRVTERTVYRVLAERRGASTIQRKRKGE